jgi:hypothetical protein
MYSGYKWWHCIRSEPLNEQNWIQLSSVLDRGYTNVDKIKKPQFHYYELYRSSSDFDENIHLVQYWNHHLENHYNNIPHVINCPMLMVKYNDKYLVHLYTNPVKKYAYLSDIALFTDVDSKVISVSEPIPSKVRFLNILYINPNMSNEILLEIPHNMFFVGNHLLSAVFVLRMLEYTVGSCVSFDMNYKLKIMDSNIQYFEMNSSEYVELELDTYKLQRVA